MLQLIISLIAGYEYYETAKAANKNKIDWGLIGFAITGSCAIIVDLLYEQIVWNTENDWPHLEFTKFWLPVLHSTIIGIIGLMTGLVILVFLNKEFCYKVMIENFASN